MSVSVTTWQDRLPGAFVERSDAVDKVSDMPSQAYRCALPFAPRSLERLARHGIALRPVAAWNMRILLLSGNGMQRSSHVPQQLTCSRVADKGCLQLRPACAEG